MFDIVAKTKWYVMMKEEDEAFSALQPLTSALPLVVYREAWHKLGKMTKQKAMEKYIALFTSVAEKLNTQEVHLSNIDRALALSLCPDFATLLTLPPHTSHPNNRPEMCWTSFALLPRFRPSFRRESRCCG
jgi:hypothetical protein